LTIIKTKQKKEAVMYAIMQVKYNMKLINLCFCSVEDAKRFKNFVDIYIDDTGAGNGYGAYWMFDIKIKRRPWLSKSAITCLNEDFIKNMLFRILSVRRAEKHPEMDISCFGWKLKGAIKFSMGKIPPRLTPKKGDMYRIPRSLGGENMLEKAEGVIIEECGEIFRTIAWYDYASGKAKPNAKIHEVKSNQVMKIYNYLKDYV
jgi:hypothetical protein